MILQCLRRWYWRHALARARRRAMAAGEIFFSKYEKDGAYHWEFYFGDKHPYYRELVDAVVGLVPQGGRVLDVGCGDGLLAHRLSEAKQCRVFGVDIHPLAIAYARAKDQYGNSFNVGSAYDCGRTAAYDTVVAMDVLEHLARPERLLENAHRVLKPGGLLVVSTPLPNASRGKSQYHVREYTEAELNALIEAHFRVQVCRRVEGEETTLIVIAERKARS